MRSNSEHHHHQQEGTQSSSTWYESFFRWPFTSNKTVGCCSGIAADYSAEIKFFSAKARRYNNVTNNNSNVLSENSLPDGNNDDDEATDQVTRVPDHLRNRVRLSQLVHDLKESENIGNTTNSYTLPDNTKGSGSIPSIVPKRGSFLSRRTVQRVLPKIDVSQNIPGMRSLDTEVLYGDERLDDEAEWEKSMVTQTIQRMEQTMLTPKSSMGRPPILYVTASNTTPFPPNQINAYLSPLEATCSNEETAATEPSDRKNGTEIEPQQSTNFFCDSPPCTQSMPSLNTFNSTLPTDTCIRTLMKKSRSPQRLDNGLFKNEPPISILSPVTVGLEVTEAVESKQLVMGYETTHRQKDEETVMCLLASPESLCDSTEIGIFASPAMEVDPRGEQLPHNPTTTSTADDDRLSGALAVIGDHPAPIRLPQVNRGLSRVSTGRHTSLVETYRRQDSNPASCHLERHLSVEFIASGNEGIITLIKESFDDSSDKEQFARLDFKSLKKPVGGKPGVGAIHAVSLRTEQGSMPSQRRSIALAKSARTGNTNAVSTKGTGMVIKGGGLANVLLSLKPKSVLCFFYMIYPPCKTKPILVKILNEGDIRQNFGPSVIAKLCPGERVKNVQGVKILTLGQFARTLAAVAKDFS